MFNEPEWMIEGVGNLNGNTNGYLPREVIAEFMRICNKIIIEKGFKTTVGSAGLKWSCNCGPGCEGD